jgi:pimeloyl-ACP methyl ester carboxylesterase
MKVEVDGHEVFVHPGGVEFDPARPVVVLLHGAGQDHSHFRFQTRALAHAGLGVLAVDMPGHGRSAGQVLASVPEMAAWVVRLLDLTGSGAPMPVHPDLQDAANRADHLAVELISGWVHTGSDRYGHHPQPGSWTRGITERLAERELGRSLGQDLAACASFDAAARASEVTVPATVVIGLADVMTNARAGRALSDALALSTTVELPGSGHNMVMDHPTEVKAAILNLVKTALGSRPGHR